MTTAGKNAIFVSQSGFAFGAIATSVSDTQIELRIPTPNDIDFDGMVSIRIDGNRFQGSIESSKWVGPYWQVTFRLAPLSQLVAIG